MLDRILPFADPDLASWLKAHRPYVEIAIADEIAYPAPRPAPGGRLSDVQLPAEWHRDVVPGDGMTTWIFALDMADKARVEHRHRDDRWYVLETGAAPRKVPDEASAAAVVERIIRDEEARILAELDARDRAAETKRAAAKEKRATKKAKKLPERPPGAMVVTLLRTLFRVRHLAGPSDQDVTQWFRTAMDTTDALPLKIERNASLSGRKITLATPWGSGIGDAESFEDARAEACLKLCAILADACNFKGSLNSWRTRLSVAQGAAFDAMEDHDAQWTDDAFAHLDLHANGLKGTERLSALRDLWAAEIGGPGDSATERDARSYVTEAATSISGFDGVSTATEAAAVVFCFRPDLFTAAQDAALEVAKTNDDRQQEILDAIYAQLGPNGKAAPPFTPASWIAQWEASEASHPFLKTEIQASLDKIRDLLAPEDEAFTRMLDYKYAPEAAGLRAEGDVEGYRQLSHDSKKTVRDSLIEGYEEDFNELAALIGDDPLLDADDHVKGAFVPKYWIEPEAARAKGYVPASSLFREATPPPSGPVPRMPGYGRDRTPPPVPRPRGAGSAAAEPDHAERFLKTADEVVASWPNPAAVGSIHGIRGLESEVYRVLQATGDDLARSAWRNQLGAADRDRLLGDVLIAAGVKPVYSMAFPEFLSRTGNVIHPGHASPQAPVPARVAQADAEIARVQRAFTDALREGQTSPKALEWWEAREESWAPPMPTRGKAGKLAKDMLAAYNAEQTIKRKYRALRQWGLWIQARQEARARGIKIPDYNESPPIMVD